MLISAPEKQKFTILDLILSKNNFLVQSWGPN